MVDDLLNGNYFTYFVDLNAENTGDLFLNDPNKPKPEDVPDTPKT